MTLLQYVEAHPWWTLVYLTVISYTIIWSTYYVACCFKKKS